MKRVTIKTYEEDETILNLDVDDNHPWNGTMYVKRDKVLDLYKDLGYQTRKKVEEEDAE